MELTCTKKEITQYTIRKGWWAIISMDEDRALLNIQSDYGSYGYIWGSPGEPFKKFLTSLDDSYLMGKLGRRDTFDGDETIKQYKLAIIGQRRCLDLNIEDARDLWDNIKEVDTTDKVSFFRDLNMDLFNSHYIDPICCMDYDYSLRGFIKIIWPEFVKILKSEITDEPIRVKSSICTPCPETCGTDNPEKCKIVQASKNE